MTIRPAHASERTYIRETALKLSQPSGIAPWVKDRGGYRAWADKARTWADSLRAVVLADGDVLVVGFALEGPAGVEVLYVRRKFRGLGFGGELMQGRRRDPVAVGFGNWSDFDG